jgi:hypothetical protein
MIAADQVLVDPRDCTLGLAGDILGRLPKSQFAAFSEGSTIALRLFIRLPSDLATCRC